MNGALADLDRVLDCFRDKRARSQKSMSRQIRILAVELARRRYVPEPDACRAGCTKSIAGCTCCWTSWAEQKAIDVNDNEILIHVLTKF